MNNYKCLILFISFIYCQYQISDIEIEGLSRLKPEDVYRVSKLYPTLFIETGDEINKGIKRLWELERFSNIQIYIIDEDENNISIKIVLEEFPVLGSVKFVGNKKQSDKQLNDYIEINEGQILTNNLLFELKKKIIDKYKEKQFHNIDIITNIKDTETEFIKNVEFVINEGSKIMIKQFNIIGNKSFKKKWWEKSWFSNFTKHQGQIMHNFENIKGEKKWYAIWRGKFSEEGFEKDLMKLNQFYKNNGFKDFNILKKEITFKDEQINILLQISEGEKYYYKSFEYEGNEKYTDNDLQAVLNLKVGELYNDEKFKFAVYENIQSLYMDEGHYKFNIQTEFVPSGNDSLNIKFIINEDEKYSIRKVEITGNNKTSENVIRRELKVLPGDVFNRKKIIESLRELYMLNFFSTVNPQILEVKDKTQIDVIIDVVEKESGRANFSMGYNELHGITGGGGVEFPNFMGKGQLFQIDYQRGIQNQLQSNSIVPSSNSQASDYESFSIRFREPRIFDTNNSIGFSISHSEQGKGNDNVYKYDVNRNSASLSFGRRFKWPDKYFTGNWSLSVSESKYFGDEIDLIEDFDEEFIIIDNNNTYAKKRGITLNQIISRDSRDQREFPSNGSTFIWSSSFSGGLLGGNINYHKHVLDLNWFSSLIPNLVLFQNYKFGLINELDENTFIPYSARFIMGGSGIPYGEMLRGYQDNVIGPTSTNNIYYSSSGGKIMLKYGIELRYLFANNPLVYMILFAEAGNVWSDFDKVDIFDLKRSAGIGIRLHMPMLGVLGYDIGYGFDNIFDGGPPSGWEYHLIFGMPFN